MRDWLLRAATCFAVLLSLDGDIAAKIASEDAKGSSWLSDYSQALTASRQSGKPIFVVFRCQH